METSSLTTQYDSAKCI